MKNRLKKAFTEYLKNDYQTIIFKESREGWLGLGKPAEKSDGSHLWDATQDRKWLSYKEAREIVWTLNLEYQEDWEAFLKGTISRDNIAGGSTKGTV